MQMPNPHGPRHKPLSKIVELAERIAALSPKERKQIGHALNDTHVASKTTDDSVPWHERESKTREKVSSKTREKVSISTEQFRSCQIRLE